MDDARETYAALGKNRGGHQPGHGGKWRITSKQRQPDSRVQGCTLSLTAEAGEEKGQEGESSWKQSEVRREEEGAWREGGREVRE